MAETQDGREGNRESDTGSVEANESTLETVSLESPESPLDEVPRPSLKDLLDRIPESNRKGLKTLLRGEFREVQKIDPADLY